MPDVLIRGLSPAAVARIDATAAALGISRNELLRRRLEESVEAAEPVVVTVADLRRAGSASADLLDDDVMGPAWR